MQPLAFIQVAARFAQSETGIGVTVLDCTCRISQDRFSVGAPDRPETSARYVHRNKI
ncbi:hypothetical protein ACFQZO_14300 [Bradyrhizobium sp. GCM10027634]|uniref:hypothetical protein n=1 Tax=unclassified Bradyrhizobium TaxID=2631580 RepID=UPI00188CC2C3|nr:MULTISPECIES: hypothetical protein [unclassified Bradyrhizobium]MDN5002059.1 hypothetical protein [Bradyrhizobium sp. WYCCWR 12677]